MKRNILILYPHNFFSEKNGINSRFLQLLHYFKSRHFQVDVLTLTNFKSSWEKYPADLGGLVQQLYFYDFARGVRFQLPWNRKRNPLVRIKQFLGLNPLYTRLPNFAFSSLKKYLQNILQTKSYDFVLISYVLWADVIANVAIGQSVTVLDLSDFMTLNRFDSSGGRIAIGPMIAEEIRRVNLFQKVLCISQDEKWFFSQFAPRPDYYYVPFFMAATSNPWQISYPYCIVFVASFNPHNLQGWQWFCNHVLPLLEQTINVHLVGSLANFTGPYPRVSVSPYVENLLDIYQSAKIVICPLLGGTGMKSKVVEALSYGLPVVTTSKGMAGLPNKVESGCIIADTPEDFALAIHKLKNDNVFYQTQKQNAILYFQEHFQSATVFSQLDLVFMKEFAT